MGGGRGGRDPRRGVVAVLAILLAALVVMATDGTLRKGSTDKGGGTPGTLRRLRPAARRRPGGGARAAAEPPGRAGREPRDRHDRAGSAAPVRLHAGQHRAGSAGGRPPAPDPLPGAAAARRTGGLPGCGRRRPVRPGGRPREDRRRVRLHALPPRPRPLARRRHRCVRAHSDHVRRAAGAAEQGQLLPARQRPPARRGRRPSAVPRVRAGPSAGHLGRLDRPVRQHPGRPDPAVAGGRPGR